MWAMGPDLRHARRRQRLLLLLLLPALLLLPGRCRGALEHLPYDRLDDMRPLVDDAGRALTTAQVDRKGVGNWSWIFERLIRSRSSQSRFPTAAEGRQKFFDKVVCIGMMKSGTTSIGVAMKRLGLVHQGRWTDDFVKQGTLDEWYQDPTVWRKMYKLIEKKVARAEGFEDYPWPFLYRKFQDLVPQGTRVGYVLTLRPCRKHAESATGYNNRNKKNRNTPRWVSDHCGRVHRRCHVHLLDIYNFFASRPGPVDDLLVIEMASHNSGRAWRQLADFTFGGGRAAYGIVPPPGSPARVAALRKFPSLPHTNSRPKWSSKLSFCQESDWDSANMTVDGQLLKDLPPHPMSTWCAIPKFMKSAKCSETYRELSAYYGGPSKIPKGVVPPNFKPALGTTRQVPYGAV
jgi:hypothetical protein